MFIIQLMLFSNLFMFLFIFTDQNCDFALQIINYTYRKIPRAKTSKNPQRYCTPKYIDVAFVNKAIERFLKFILNLMGHWISLEIVVATYLTF